MRIENVKRYEKDLYSYITSLNKRCQKFEYFEEILSLDYLNYDILGLTFACIFLNHNL